MRLTDFKVLSFDCYGTLIDWESGLLRALEPLLDRLAPRPDLATALAGFAEFEAAQEAETPSLLYRDLLAEVYRRLAKHWKLRIADDEANAFGRSVGHWPAFADSPAALRYLKQHFRLVILSNVDRESFKGSQQRLGVAFDAIYTAEEIGSYKPDPRNFDYLIARLGEQGFAKSDMLHVAQSLYHDHAPANRLGLASAWIERPHHATKQVDPSPRFDFRFASLAELADAHRASSAPSGGPSGP